MSTDLDDETPNRQLALVNINYNNSQNENE